MNWTNPVGDKTNKSGHTLGPHSHRHEESKAEKATKPVRDLDGGWERSLASYISSPVSSPTFQFKVPLTQAIKPAESIKPGKCLQPDTEPVPLGFPQAWWCMPGHLSIMLLMREVATGSDV